MPNLQINKMHFDTIKKSISSYISTFKMHIKNKNEIVKTQQLLNLKKNKDVIVIGNGPSVSKVDANKLKYLLENNDIEVIASNNFLLSEFSKDIKPNFYVLSDPDWFFPEKTNKGDGFVEDIKLNNGLLQKENIPIFMPISFKDKHIFLNEIYYFNDSVNFLKNYSNNILAPRSFGSLTGFKAIRIADYLGYENIYIIGMDTTHFLDFYVNAKNQLVKKHNHFFNDKKTSEVKFIKNKTTSENLFECAKLFQSLENINKHTSKMIFNLDPDSYVDAFTKIHELDIYKN